MKRKLIFRFIIVCSLALNVAFLAMWFTHATPRFLMAQRFCKADTFECRKCPLHQALSLSDSQWNVLSPRIETYRKAVDSFQREIATARESLLNELEKSPADTAVLAVFREQVLDGQRKMQEHVVANVLEQKAVLTAEQQRRFIEMMRSGMGCERGLGVLGIRQTMYKKGEGGEEGRKH
jgi:Spy/CpxP family protein refolding chaperone